MTAEHEDRVHNVLVVEDDDMLASRLVEYLQGRGFGVTAVASLPSARDLLKRHAFDAVVLDLNLGRPSSLPHHASTNRTACSVSSSAPMTTWSSRTASANCWPASRW